MSMQIIPQRELPRLLRQAGLEPQSREFPDATVVRCLTIREHEPPPFIKGPHRKMIYADGRTEGPFPLVDRPALAAYIVEALQRTSIPAVLAVVPEGAFWLNNRSQSAYLARVPDALRVGDYLRRRGLTDRFRGGFRVEPSSFAHVLPLLAANTFSGGADVLFAALGASSRHLSILACHHFDLHVCTPDPAIALLLAEMAPGFGLSAATLAIPDLQDAECVWG